MIIPQGQRGIVAWCLLALILVAAGCVAPTPTATRIPPSPTLSPTPTPPPTPTIPSLSEGRVLTIATLSDPPHYDVHQAFSPALHRAGPGLVYSRLLRFRSGDGVDTFALEVECDLCVTWEQTDSTTYRFTLRQGVRWHDIPPVSGRELTAADIVYSYQRQATPGWDNASLLQNIQSIRELDRHTLEIKTRTPDADFLIILADGHNKIVAREVVEEYGDLREAPPIGTGPWQWESGFKRVEYLLRRNPSYYEEGIPRADWLRILVIPDLKAQLTNLKVDDLDVGGIPPSEAASLGTQPSSPALLKVTQYGQGPELVLNTQIPPFQDILVRQAVFLALDPQRYVMELWPEASFTGLGMPVVSPDWLLPPDEIHPYWGDQERAAELLDQAGTQPTFVLTVADYGDVYLALGEAMAEDLRKVGFNVQTRVVTPVEYVGQVWGESQYSAYLGPLAPMTTPNDYFLGVLHSQGSANTTGYQDAELDRLLEAQARTFDPEARRDLVQQVQRRALEGAVRFMVATQTSYWAWKPRVEGFHPNLAGYEYFFYARTSVPAP